MEIQTEFIYKGRTYSVQAHGVNYRRVSHYAVADRVIVRNESGVKLPPGLSPSFEDAVEGALLDAVADKVHNSV